jgi:hypothetical protein
MAATRELPDVGSQNMGKQNPFRMPSDEEIFSLRDDERARKEEVGSRNQSCCEI